MVSHVPRRALQEIQEAGAGDRRAVLRGRGADQEPGARQGVQQALRRRVHCADSGRAEGAERQGAAGGESQLVPDDLLPRT